MGRRRPVLLFLFCLFVSSVLYLTFWNGTSWNDDSGIRFVKKTNGTCSLPYFQVNNYMFSHGKKLCPSKPLDCTLFDNDTTTYLNDGCSYRIVSRKNDFLLYYSGWTSAKSLSWDDDVVLEIQCPQKQSIFSEYCIFRKINRRPELVKALLGEDIKAPSHDLNVLMIGLDSLSRLEFMQQLSKSRGYVIDSLGGIEFNGYTIVGDGTTAAFFAMLVGTFEDRIHETRRGFQGASALDDIPFIWQELHRHGYVTLHDETDPGTGTFQLRLLGFDSPPAHYYGRPFQLASNAGGRYHNLCFKNRSRFNEGLSNVRQLFEKYHDVRKFAIFFESSLTHTEYPHAELIDDELLAFLKSFVKAGHLDSTMLVLFSDHGPRYGQTRQTIIGKYKERSPIMAVVLPEKFKRNNPHIVKNMRWNGDYILTTPLDMHATFLDILGVKKANKLETYGRSLFSSLPANRSCEEAGVAPHWCPCANGEPVEVTSHLVLSSVKVFLEIANEWLQIAEGKCMPLASAVPISASIVRPGGKMASFQETVDGHGRVPSYKMDSVAGSYFLVVTVKIEPGGGMFEATIEIGWDGRVTVQRSQVSRTNAYGHAADCIMEEFPQLREFCFCDYTRVKLF